MPAGAPPHPPGHFSAWEEVMEVALDQARQAESLAEVPVGAVLLEENGNILARACNRPVATHDPTGHAEILALRAGGQVQHNYRLPGTILVVTLEPCLMCLGAILHARVAGLVYGAEDPKSGAVHSRLQGAELPWSNHTFWTLGGVLADRSAALLQTFFRSRRFPG